MHDLCEDDDDDRGSVRRTLKYGRLNAAIEGRVNVLKILCGANNSAMDEDLFSISN